MLILRLSCFYSQASKVKFKNTAVVVTKQTLEDFSDKKGSKGYNSQYEAREFEWKMN